MNTPAIFRFKNHAVRQVMVNGELGFVAKDVAEALGYNWNGGSRIAHVPAEWRGVTSVVTLRGDAQDMHILFEPGLYFFLGRSDKQAALPFQKWLAGEVLPAIRKTGSYTSPNAQPSAPQPIADPSWEQCQQCEDHSRKAIWELQHHLLAKCRLWNDIHKYHSKNLNNREIATLVKLSPAALRRQMKEMHRCGLLCPRDQQEFSRMQTIDFRHKYALPSPYGLLAKRKAQLQLFPVGVLEGGK